MKMTAKKTSNWSPQFPNVYELLLKEDWMLHIGKHGPVLAFWKHVAVITFQVNKYFS